MSITSLLLNIVVANAKSFSQSNKVRKGNKTDTDEEIKLSPFAENMTSYIQEKKKKPLKVTK